MRTTTASVLFVAVCTLSACNKKEGSQGAASGGKSAEPAAAAPAKLTWKKLGALGLEAEVPEHADVDDTSSGAGFPSATIYASPTTFVSGTGDLSDVKPTLEETKARLEKDPNKLTGWTKEEKTEDGWLLEGTRQSMMGDTLYAISVRRTIDGKPYDCGTNASSEAEREKAKAICQSLRVAK